MTCMRPKRILSRGKPNVALGIIPFQQMFTGTLLGMLIFWPKFPSAGQDETNCRSRIFDDQALALRIWYQAILRPGTFARTKGLDHCTTTQTSRSRWALR